MLPGVITDIVLSAVDNSRKRTPNISFPKKKLIKFDKKLIEYSFFVEFAAKDEVFLSYVWLLLSVREVLNFTHDHILHID